MKVMPRSIAAWISLIMSSSGVLGAPMWKPPIPTIETCSPVRPSRRLGISPVAGRAWLDAGAVIPSSIPGSAAGHEPSVRRPCRHGLARAGRGRHSPGAQRSSRIAVRAHSAIAALPPASLGWPKV